MAIRLFIASICMECGSGNIYNEKIDNNPKENTGHNIEIKPCEKCGSEDSPENKQKIHDEIYRALEFEFSLNDSLDTVIEAIVNNKIPHLKIIYPLT